MSLFSEEAMKWVSMPDGDYLNIQKDFTKGLVVKMAEKPQEENKVSKKSGKTYRTFIYNLLCEDGVQREMSSWSKRLINALVDANVNVGDWFILTAIGDGYEPDTCTVVKTTTPTDFGKKIKQETDLTQIPF